MGVAEQGFDFRPERLVLATLLRHDAIPLLLRLGDDQIEDLLDAGPVGGSHGAALFQGDLDLAVEPRAGEDPVALDRGR